MPWPGFSDRLGAVEAERLPASAAHPDVLTRFGQLGETLLDRGEDIPGHPADVAVDQQVVASVEDGEIDQQPVLTGACRRVIPVGGVREDTIEGEVAQVPRDRCDRLILGAGLLGGEGGKSA